MKKNALRLMMLALLFSSAAAMNGCFYVEHVHHYNDYDHYGYYGHNHHY